MPKRNRSLNGGVWPFDIFQNPDVPKEGIMEKITKVKNTIGKVKNKIKAKFRKKPPALDTQVDELKSESPGLMYPRRADPFAEPRPLDPVTEPLPLYQAPRPLDPVTEPLPLYQAPRRHLDPVTEPLPLYQAPRRHLDPVTETRPLDQAPRRHLDPVTDNMRPPPRGYAGGRRRTRRNKKTKPKSKSKKRR